MATRRVLLKVSGEMLAGGEGFGIDRQAVDRFAAEIHQVRALGPATAVVVGGGNIFRGISATGMDRPTADSMGMLATVINALALADGLERRGCPARALSAVRMDQVAEPYLRWTARAHLDEGRVVVLAGGTGSPFFSTDTAAALRAAELDMDLLIKGTKVDGVYDKDPALHDDAVRFDRLGYDEVLSRQLRVMDLTAISMCMDARIPVVVCDMSAPGNLSRVVRGEPVGTRIGD